MYLTDCRRKTSFGNIINILEQHFMDDYNVEEEEEEQQAQLVQTPEETTTEINQPKVPKLSLRRKMSVERLHETWIVKKRNKKK